MEPTSHPGHVCWSAKPAWPGRLAGVGDYPWNSPYAFAENRVIDGIDLEGLEHQSYTILLSNDGKTHLSTLDWSSSILIPGPMGWGTEWKWRTKDGKMSDTLPFEPSAPPPVWSGHNRAFWVNGTMWFGPQDGRTTDGPFHSGEAGLREKVEYGPGKGEMTQSFVDNGALNPTFKVKDQLAGRVGTSTATDTEVKSSAELFVKFNLTRPQESAPDYLKATYPVKIKGFGLYVRTTTTRESSLESVEIGLSTSKPKPKVEYSVPLE